MLVRIHDYRPDRYGYRCGYHHQRGRTVCTNSLEAPMEVANRAVLDTVEHHFLRPEITEAAVATALEALLPADDTAEHERAALLTQLRQVGAELERLAAAIAEGGALPPPPQASKDREGRRAQL